jgi:CheY-like chemotaxis protein
MHSETSNSAKEATRLRLLIIEDEPLIAMMLEEMVVSLGHCVIRTCANLRDAIDSISAGGFDAA